MIAAISLLVVLTVSLLVTRVATVALAHTGLSREAARFQARSALTGVGYTTSESEKVVNHPVRRKILMLLMLIGNAGIVTVVSSAILTFVDTGEPDDGWLIKVILLIIGLAGLWTAAQSQWLDRRISRLVSVLLKRYTDIDVRDYSGLLHLGGDYQIAELLADPEGWVVDRKLAELRLRDEGIVVLGIQTPGGAYFGAPTGETEIKAGFTLWLYGRADSMKGLDDRRSDVEGHIEHNRAVAEQYRQEREQQEALEEIVEESDDEKPD